MLFQQIPHTAPPLRRHPTHIQVTSGSTSRNETVGETNVGKQEGDL